MGRVCSKIERVCPGIEELYRLLEEKRKWTGKIVQGVYRVRVDGELLLAYADEVLEGHLQDIHMSRQRLPDRILTRMVMLSTPGIHVCLYARYYCGKGLLHNDFMSLEGSGGYGKSTFAIYLADRVGGVVFTKEDDVLLGLLALQEKGEWIPLLVLDDIAAIISKYWFLSGKERVWSKFFRALEYAKDITGIVLTTARTYEGQAKRLRELSTLEGEVNRVPIQDYLVDFILWRRNRRPVYIDILYPGLLLPEDVWERMNRRRRLYTRLLLLETIKERAKEGVIQDVDVEQIEEEIEELRKQLLEV